MKLTYVFFVRHKIVGISAGHTVFGSPP